jgi:hypothetical protein
MRSPSAAPACYARANRTNDDRVAADVGPSPGDLAPRIERDAVGGSIASGEPRSPRIGLVGVIGVGLCLGVFDAGKVSSGALSIVRTPLRNVAHR